MSEKVAYVFPGQGSQKVGMGYDLYNNFPAAKAVFEQVDEKLKFPFSRLCFEGPEEELKQTVNTQPAIVTVSLACLKAVQTACGERFPLPSFMAGHSLGEYAALAAAGAIDFSAATYLVRQRGRLMQEAGQINPGTMAAVLGMEETVLAEVCRETGTWLANINYPGQLVISGPVENVAKAVALVQARGIRAVPLQVSGAFHSPLMQPAVDGLSKTLADHSFHNPSIPVIANTTAQPLTAAGQIKNELLQQLTTSVQWQKSVEYMINNGVSTFIEIGPGKVLAGLIKRINRQVKIINIGDINEVKGFTC